MNRPDLMALLGERVTVTNPDIGTTWTGDLIAIADEPSIVIDQGERGRMTLPQRFTISRADYTPAPIPPWEQEILDSQAATISLENTLLAHLGRMLANLQAHIDQRADEIAAPRIAAALADANEQVIAVEESRGHWRQRFEDLQREISRQVSVLERHRDQLRADIARVRELHTPEDVTFARGAYPERGETGTVHYVQKCCTACGGQAGYEPPTPWPCPTIRALDGTLDQQEANRG